MNKDKIAILVDSCTNVPQQYVDQYGMFVVPTKIIFSDREYTDGVDITPEVLYQRFAIEIPKTSLPSAGDIAVLFDQIKAQGYEKVLSINISSGLSGTYGVVDMMGQKTPDLEVHAIDTKNIAIGSGFLAIQAAQYLASGMGWTELVQRMEAQVPRSKLFFCVKTLDYLQKGGRIGLVASLLGNALNLKPIITCNPDGIYDVVAKVRGRKQSLKKALDLACDFARGHHQYYLTVMHSNAADEAQAILEEAQALLPEATITVTGEITPSLVVHTGPGLIGVGVNLLD